MAEVAIGPQPRQGAVTRDGKGEAVAGMVIMLRGENSKDVVARVKDAIPKIQNSLPEGARINVFYDRTGLDRGMHQTVMNALMEGGIFVILVLFLFVAELRTALIVVVSLPITFLATFHCHGLGRHQLKPDEPRRACIFRGHGGGCIHRDRGEYPAAFCRERTDPERRRRSSWRLWLKWRGRYRFPF